MKRIFAVLLCVVMVAVLAACGGKDDAKEKKSKADTSAVSDTVSADEKDEKSSDKETGDSLDLPEDGKIYFGKDNKKNSDTGKSTSDSNKNDSSKQSGKSTGGNTSETSEPSGNNDDTSSATSGDSNYGGIGWNVK